MNESVDLIYHTAVLSFVIGSIVSMGLDLTVREIVEAIKNIRLVTAALLDNFILVPLFAYSITEVIPMSMGVQEGLILLSVASGAIFLPRLTLIADRDPALSVGLMLLLMIVTIFFMPLVLPYLMKVTHVSGGDIARSLVMMMLLPLFAAFLLKAGFPKLAKILKPIFAKISNLGLMVLGLILVGLHGKRLLDLWGPELVAVMLLIAGAMSIGYLSGGKDKERRFILSIATGQRNLSASVLVAVHHFHNPDVMLTIVAAAIFGLIIMYPYAKKVSG